MATQVYKTYYVQTINGKEIEITPLKIKYMRDFMDIFGQISKGGMNADGVLDTLCDCVRVAMKQYAPEYSNSINDILDNFDIKTLYNILDFSAGIKINLDKEETLKSENVQQKEGSSWKDFDLVKLETEVFLLGIWKNYEELEMSMSIPELLATISISRELDYEEKKFLAATQGINLEGGSESEGQKKWEDMKARVFSRGATNDSKDILALQGYNAEKAGFGIGMGLDYEDLRTTK